jgi:xylan 1,4-beta-xylosidase
MRLLLILLCCALPIFGQAIEIRVNFAETNGPMRMNQMALGQGGLSDEVMFGDRIAELRALKPAVIRLFIQEYFNLLPEPRRDASPPSQRYHFDTLDRNVDAIVATGASPLMCICFKPRVLFPEINQDIVEPNDYAAWEKLIEDLVRHYKERGTKIRYWEVGNEVDIGEDGGCPFRFKPDSYVRFYKHTADAVMRADADARVGGPALANVRSPIFPALLAAAATNSLPLHFVSWHIYNSDPKAVRGTIDYAKGLLAKHPALKPETFLDEWNMDLTNPPLDPRFQPAYVAETIWQMKEGGLDYSCYYHIRDYYVSFEQFAPFMSERGTAFMTRWWNRMPQFDGLFDYQNTIRPAYFAFKLLSRLEGDRHPVASSSEKVHAFATHDPKLRMHNLVVWNFSRETNAVTLRLDNLPGAMRHRHIVLDAATASGDENARLRPDPFKRIDAGDQTLEVTLEPWAIHYWSFE